MSMAWEQYWECDKAKGGWRRRDGERGDAVKAIQMINVPVQVWLVIQLVDDLTR